jgi:hypothetical protein
LVVVVVLVLEETKPGACLSLFTAVWFRLVVVVVVVSSSRFRMKAAPVTVG